MTAQSDASNPAPSIEKIPFNDKTLLQIARLPFEQRPVGVSPTGTVLTASVPAGMTDYFVRDANMKGFSLRVTAKSRVFYAERKLAGKPCRFPCGDFPATGLKVAQKKAAEALAKIAEGIDPNHVVKDNRKATAARYDRDKLTFEFVVKRDAERQAATDAPGTLRDRRDVAQWVGRTSIWHMPVHDVTAADLKAMMDQLTTTISGTTALKCWRYTRAAWSRMSSVEEPPLNPFDEYLKTHKLPAGKRRTTALDTEETQSQDWLRTIAKMRTTPTGRRPWTKRVMADYILLSLAWGARRSESAALRWSDVDFDRKFVQFRDTKNGSTHAFPLTDTCAQLLRDLKAHNETPRGRDVRRAAKGETIEFPEWVFPSERRGLHLVEPQGALDIGEDGSGLKIRMHDLRRSFAGSVAETVMINGTQNFGLVKIALNHADQKADITQTYIGIKSKLNMLRPIYLAHERRVFEAAGLMEPAQPSDADALLDALKAQAANNPAVLDQLRTLLQAAG
ncbi:TPA: integrase family protein [Burkholderia vietnamiensis]|uniref:tyrosine-type recombinase/integrase n=1 Tax=Burkholderia TaxID=32008 RepID=UPI00158EADFA|nr:MULTISPECIES: site-specific integrase [Burkholderia]HDR8945453.1 integrase family protein [Burkholderia vietnamiensis]HDR9206686.1 integrase family protein [Burkholderia vietnamiensis]